MKSSSFPAINVINSILKKTTLKLISDTLMHKLAVFVEENLHEKMLLNTILKVCTM